jgi:hypothetical protein
MSKIIFLTFGGPTTNYHNAVKRICKEAQDFELFDEIYGYTDDDLKSDNDFWSKHGEFIENNKRGYGYWIWKPFLIQKKLSEINYGDFLIYADCGCEINKNGKKRFLEYIELINNDCKQYGLLSFQMNHLEKLYTKSEIFKFFDVDDNIKNSGMCVATMQIIKKTHHSIDIINKWLENMHYNLINDKCNVENECFVDNRHDQSIYSVIVKKYGSIKLPDETWYENWNDGQQIPILAKRNK